jgi:DNA-3-methyladenine glycosylase II
MTPHAYRRFLATAREVSPPLHAVIRSIGRLEMPDRRRRGLPWFLARAIVGQQLSTLAARSIWQRLEIAVRANDSAVPAFFCGRNVPVLRQCGISSAKIRALIAIREAYDDGRLSARRLARLSHAERADHLTQIWGIGQWTADMCSIFYFRDPDVWPEGDVGVYRGIEKVTGRRSRKAILALADRFVPHRSYLALYMWRVLDARPD